MESQWFLTFYLPRLPSVIVLFFKPPNFKQVNWRKHFSIQNFSMLWKAYMLAPPLKVIDAAGEAVVNLCARPLPFLSKIL